MIAGRVEATLGFYFTAI